MWNDNELFCESLDESILSLMKTKKENLIFLLNKSIQKLNDQWLKKQAWLAIALSQPDLDLLTLQQIAKILMLSNDNLFYLLNILGNKVLLDEFAKQHTDIDVVKMISKNGFYAYRKAAENGHVDVLEYLETTVPTLTRGMIKAVNFSAYQNASRNGHLEVLKHLETEAPDLIQDMIKAQNFYAFRIAAAQRHWPILNHLETKTPDLVLEMVQADNFYAYRKAAENAHFDVSKWILSKSSCCLAYAEMHGSEYGENIIKPFIAEQLIALHRAALNIPPHNVFDINHPEQAKICFYIIRNLIRRNDRALDDEIRFLLNIPSVKTLAHHEVTAGQPNELLRLALTTGNQEAASILLNIPRVRALAEQNDFYRAESHGQLNLAQLARDRESSMTALTRGEQRRLAEAIRHYKPTLKEKGVENLMNSLREQLRQRYEKNPASIINAKGTKINLPMDFADLQKLKLSKREYQQALTVYYQHKAHTAWRYIAKPNLWMNAEAEYVHIDETSNERWSTFEEYQVLISLLWVAACDEAIPPTDEHTLASRQDHFIDELALIGRAHNWDKTRINDKGKIEEYDDLTGDKPSCFSGVKRRLFQSVLGHPLISILTEDKILEEIRDFARNHFQSNITLMNKTLLKEAFDDYVININEITEENKKLLETLNIPKEKIDLFESYLSNKYGAQYIEDFNFQKLVHDKLKLTPERTDFFSHCHALILDGLTGFSQILHEDSDGQKQQPDQPNPLRFFKPVPSDNTALGKNDRQIMLR
ncbi:hypothetical protein [Legionella norrlandica]|nr:hypothetical protein [Legionella norrlandica]